MPFYFDDFDPADYAIDPDSYEPPPDARQPTYHYVYRPAAGRFDPGGDAYDAIAYDALVAIGATAVRVRYDGGGDEGYAHVESVRVGDVERPAAEVVAKLGADREVEARAGTVRPTLGSHYLEGLSGVPLAEALLDRLAFRIAVSLVGGGFGVGVSSIYGAAWADLETFDVTDDPDASPPDKD
jgi:hypothetical protein